MIAAVTTLSFLVAAWATVYAVIVSLDDSSAKVVAALKGDSMLAREPVLTRPVTVRISGRHPSLRSQSARAKPEWRAAA